MWVSWPSQWFPCIDCTWCSKTSPPHWRYCWSGLFALTPFSLFRRGFFSLFCLTWSILNISGEGTSILPARHSLKYMQVCCIVISSSLLIFALSLVTSSCSWESPLFAFSSMTWSLWLIPSFLFVLIAWTSFLTHISKDWVDLRTKI